MKSENFTSFLIFSLLFLYKYKGRSFKNWGNSGLTDIKKPNDLHHPVLAKKV